MKMSTQQHPLTALWAVVSAALLAAFAIAAGNAQAALVTLEAESAVAGVEWSQGADGSVTFVSPTTTTAGEFPGSSARVITFTVTFPEPGMYDLYGRVRVGPEGANDDSLFYANGFGTKSPTTGADWIRINNLVSGGQTNTNDVVTGVGNAGILVWKWVNLSQFANGIGETPITFTVPAGSLTQTFQIGAREDGLALDKFVFGTTGTAFTVAELDSGSNSPPVLEQLDLVEGNLIQFNDNGTWSWFQDERAVVDTNGGKIVIGSDASGSGRGGFPREGDVEAAIFDLATGTSQMYTLKSGDSRPSVFYADDHNVPGLLVLPNGKYLAIYAGHNTEKFSYWRIFDSSVWSPEQSYDWNTQPGGADFNTTYSNRITWRRNAAADASTTSRAVTFMVRKT
jgi:hypothetical protein